MRIGDIDGFNEVYTPQGILILEANEELLFKFPNRMLEVDTQWRLFFVNYVFPPRWGEGTLYITDRRIVFIRRPLDAWLIKFTFPLYRAIDYDTALIDKGIEHSRRVNAQEGFDFVEIRYEHIAFVRKGLLYRRLCILDDGKHYQSYLDRDIYKAMIPILSKKAIVIIPDRSKRSRKIKIPKS
jgi:hypothetical protein